ncbi:hypothetical protein Cgig2_026427 [Carnegiea gigantea]|uniref:Protein kinase domain-containing protein n=1 Tax=Carnegiea gigantea TaxID=171969 RepID=A0A9Q1GM83_9CARY|nr:hypothetical protein Cgig2_026427 [Carnegiea gigantea]
MGCILGKHAAGDDSAHSSPAPDHHRRRRPSSLTLGREPNEQSNKLRRHSSNLSHFELRRHMLDSYGPTNEYGWPTWLADVVGDAINHFTPRRASSFEKLDKIGQGTYSNVYKARDLITGNIVALKKVRFDKSEPEGVKFMAREILILCRLDHPNVIKLQGLVTSRMSSSVYLVFDYMDHDLAGLSASLAGAKFTEPQVKCFVKQLFSGLEHCHINGVLHRDIKGSNLLIDHEGILKIADFGLATFYDPNHKQPMTSRVVTLWYRSPELLLGAIHYGVGVDLWSAGCILAELLAGKPIMPGRTEVEQLHMIFKLCGSPSEDYWQTYKLPNATLFKPQQSYKRCILETFKEFPPSSLPLLDRLLSVDPDARGTATDALNSEFFTTEPCACEASSLPKYPPSKEMDVKLRDAAVRRQKGKANAADVRRDRIRDQAGREIRVPEANVELQLNVNGGGGRGGSWGGDTSNNGPLSFGPTEHFFDASHFDPKLSRSVRSIAPAEGPSRRKRSKREPKLAPTWKFFNAWKPSTIGLSMDLLFKGKRPISNSRKNFVATYMNEMGLKMKFVEKRLLLLGFLVVAAIVLLLFPAQCPSSGKFN